MAKWYEYAFPVVGTVLRNLFFPGTVGGASNTDVVNSTTPGRNVTITSDDSGYHQGEGFFQRIWNDLTGISQIRLQNDFNKEMAEEEYQRNLDSIADTAAAYEAAGYNRNLLYSGSNSPVKYQAPNLQAYSGSARLDSILSRVGKVLSFIPAMYQATAALESIDQARERTKQSQIKTMSDGINLINQSFGLGNNVLSNPFAVDLGVFGEGKRRFNVPHISDIDVYGYGRGEFIGDVWYPYFTPGTLRYYADSALRNRLDLLDSIGISNSLRQTRNSYLGYQYGLDRRFGAAGRIVGMASQGLGAAARLITPGMKFFFK